MNNFNTKRWQKLAGISNKKVIKEQNFSENEEKELQKRDDRVMQSLVDFFKSTKEEIKMLKDQVRELEEEKNKTLDDVKNERWYKLQYVLGLELRVIESLYETSMPSGFFEELLSSIE